MNANTILLILQWHYFLADTLSRYPWQCLNTFYTSILIFKMWFPLVSLTGVKSLVARLVYEGSCFNDSMDGGGGGGQHFLPKGHTPKGAHKC